MIPERKSIFPRVKSVTDYRADIRLLAEWNERQDDGKAVTRSRDSAGGTHPTKKRLTAVRVTHTIFPF